MRVPVQTRFPASSSMAICTEIVVRPFAMTVAVAVTAVVALKPGTQLSADELIAWARERLAGFKCPRVVRFVDALPRTATGKVLKRELRKLWTADGAAVQR